MKRYLIGILFLFSVAAVFGQKYPYDFPLDTTVNGSEFIPYQQKQGSNYISYQVPFPYAKKYFSPNVVTSPISFVPDTASTARKYNYLGKFVTDPAGIVWYIDGVGGVLQITSDGGFSGSWNDLSGVPAGFSDGVDDVNDADASPTNELQTIDVFQLSGNNLQLSIANDGEATKTVDLSGLAGGGDPALGGALTGTASNAGIADNAVTNSKIAVGAGGIYRGNGTAAENLRVLSNGSMFFGKDSAGDTAFIFLDPPSNSLQLINNEGTTLIGKEAETGQYGQVEINVEGGQINARASTGVNVAISEKSFKIGTLEGYQQGAILTAFPSPLTQASDGATVLYEKTIGLTTYVAQYIYMHPDWIPTSGAGLPKYDSYTDATTAGLTVGEWFAASATNELGLPFLTPVKNE